MSGTPDQNNGEFPSWYINLQAAVLKQLPRPGTIDSATALSLERNQLVLKAQLYQALCSPQPSKNDNFFLATVAVGQGWSMDDLLGDLEAEDAAIPRPIFERLLLEKVAKKPGSVKLCAATVQELTGKKDRAKFFDVKESIKLRGYNLCTAESAVCLALQGYHLISTLGRINVITESNSEDGGELEFFLGKKGSRIKLYRGITDGNQWNEDSLVLFESP